MIDSVLNSISGCHVDGILDRIYTLSYFNAVLLSLIHMGSLCIKGFIYNSYRGSIIIFLYRHKSTVGISKSKLVANY